MQFRGQCGAQRMVDHRYTTLPCSVLHAGSTGLNAAPPWGETPA
ncbi:hypothetical protein BURCENK562V_C5505 [Burkholderia cenocepacia K56-2Valvano]|nr:hypothetical protein BURCENK562V_C5505 [Burkholderia cenocepacia K56-2Valvano]